MSEEAIREDATFVVGEFVRSRDSVRPRGYANRTGIVVAIQGTEVGVNLDSERTHSAATWFRDNELMKVGQGRLKAPRRPVKSRLAETALERI